MKKVLEFCLVIIIFGTILCVNNVEIYAATPLSGKSEPTRNMDTFASIGNAGDAGIAAKNVMGTIIQTIKVIGYGIAIIMLLYVGVKYMSAAPDEKAEFKKSATAYIVGAIVLFASATLVDIIANFATTNIG